MRKRHHTTVPAATAALSAALLVSACASAVNEPKNATVTAFSSVSGSGSGSSTTGPAPATSSSAQAAPAPIPTDYNGNANANADIAAGLALAKQTHRNVIIDFGTDQCSDCTTLHRDYQDPAVKPILQKSFVVVTVDIGSFNANMDISHTYRDAAKNGMPALAVLDPSGDILTTTSDGSFANARYMPVSQVVAFLNKWLPAG